MNDVDVGVVRSSLGVAEAGAVWLTQRELVAKALAVLSQHLVVLLDHAAVVWSLHGTYGRIDVAASPFGVFLAGPSATGDIEGWSPYTVQGNHQRFRLGAAQNRVALCLFGIVVFWLLARPRTGVVAPRHDRHRPGHLPAILCVHSFSRGR